MDRRWERAMAQMADFVAAHGRFPKRHSSEPGEEQLANWLYYMRSLHGRSALSPERLQQLDTLGDWQVPAGNGVAEAKWSRQLADLAAFIDGSGRLPSRGVNAGEQEWSLALFVHRQRRRARAGTLQPERAARLEEVAPGWNTGSDPHQLRRARDQHAAAWARVEPHATVILAGLASGRSPAQMAAMTGVPHQLLFGLARHNQRWAEQFEEALMQGRNPALQHGTSAAYRHGCRCKDCRNLIVRYRGQLKEPTEPGTTASPGQ